MLISSFLDLLNATLLRACVRLPADTIDRDNWRPIPHPELRHAKSGDPAAWASCAYRWASQTMAAEISEASMKAPPNASGMERDPVPPMSRMSGSSQHALMSSYSRFTSSVGEP